MSKHTPGPWFAGTTTVYIKDLHVNGEESSPTVAKCQISGHYGHKFPRGEPEANAAHIVHCVNLHDELVTALNGALVALKLGANVDQQAAIDYGMEILAKAKGDGK